MFFKSFTDAYIIRMLFYLFETNEICRENSLNNNQRIKYLHLSLLAFLRIFLKLKRCSFHIIVL